jgi:tetratricopeptide (TPR) repeat protein
MNKLYCLTITVMVLLASCDTRSGTEYFESGLKNYQLGDHGDYFDDVWLNKANKDFEKAIVKGYKEREVFDKLAWSYLHLNQSDYKNAEKVYSLGIDQFPKDGEFYFCRAMCREDQKKFKEALWDYDKAISLDTLEKFEYLSSAYYDRGAMSFILGDTISAERDRTKAQLIKNEELRAYKDYCGHLLR